MNVIRVNVKLYGTLRKYASGYDHEKGIDVSLGEGETVKELLRVLGIPENEARLFFVGGISRRLSDRLNDADEINIFLPIAGG